MFMTLDTCRQNHLNIHFFMQMINFKQSRQLNDFRKQYPTYLQGATQNKDFKSILKIFKRQ